MKRIGRRKTRGRTFSLNPKQSQQGRLDTQKKRAAEMSTKRRKHAEDVEESSIPAGEQLPADEEKTAAANVVVKYTEGTSFVKYKPVFSFDSKYLFVPSANFVRVYATQTGEYLHQLSHEVEVVSVCTNPRNNLQLVSCCRNGVISFWDYIEGILHKSVETKRIVANMFMPAPDGNLFLVTDRPQSDVESESEYAIQYTFQFIRLKLGSLKNSFTIFERVERALDVSVGGSGTFAALIDGAAVCVKFFDDMVLHRHLENSKQRFLRITAHPTECCVATGDGDGRIFLWNELRRERFVRTVYHWHQLPVAEIALSATGSRMASGGGECVLVKWRLDADWKQFIPRTGMPICHVVISPDNSYIATSHVDNAIHLFNTMGKIVQVIQGLTRCHQWEEFGAVPIQTGILYHAPSNALVMNGKPGHLQFYSILEGKYLFNLDITRFNYHCQEREFTVIQTEVQKAAFDSRGNWLATVEIRDDGKTSPDIRLKFWLYNPARKNFQFQLNTVVELPHLSGVNVLKFQPETNTEKHVPLAVTCSQDNRFKIWTLSDDSDIYQSKQSWNCASVGYYRKLCPADADFSDDGSVLAIAFASTVTLWIPETNFLKETLCHPWNNEHVQQVKFGRETCCQYLVCSTSKDISAWDVLSLQVKWCVNMHVSHLSKDDLSENMAVFTEDKYLFVFKPSETRPLYWHENVCDGRVICSAFLPRKRDSSEVVNEELKWQKNSVLYFMNSEQHLLRLEDATSEKEKDEDIRKVVLQQNLPVTPFSLLLAKQAKLKQIYDAPVPHILPETNKELMDQLLTSASHTLPPVRVLCSAFSRSLLIPRKKQSTEVFDEEVLTEVVDEEESDDSDMEVDSVPVQVEGTKSRRATQVTTPANISQHEPDLSKLARKNTFKWLFPSSKSRPGKDSEMFES